MITLPCLDDTDPSFFPPVESALIEPNGLLAMGGDLSAERLLHAYRQGIFPWFDDESIILWWSPDPRMILQPGEFRIYRSLQKVIKQNKYQISVDRDFENVIKQCATVDERAKNTWITNSMEQAYSQLHQMGFAHSFEVWDQDRLVGGLYGVAIGNCFFGESMFSHEKNTSKIAMATLASVFSNQPLGLIDCQVPNPHLEKMGAKAISRTSFYEMLYQSTTQQQDIPWQSISENMLSDEID